MFVVYLKPQIPRGTFTAFETFNGAIKHAENMISGESERAEVFEVLITDEVLPAKRVPAAIAALKMGEGTLVAARGLKASAKQIEKSERDQAMRELMEELGILPGKDSSDA
jgi:hypothetical protein